MKYDIPYNYKLNVFLYGYLLPIIIWYAIVYMYLYKNLFTSVISYELIILSLPLIIIFINLYILYNKNENVQNYYKPCISTDVKESDKKKGIIGYFNNRCLNDHFYLSQEIIGDLTNRFYSLGYILFLFMLVVQNTFDKKDEKLQLIILLSFFLSIIGSCITQWFQWDYYPTLISQHTASTIMTFNISMVIFVMYYLYNKFNNSK